MGLSDHLPDHLVPILDRDHALSREHGVMFRVVSRPAGWRPNPDEAPPFELPREDGGFDDPAHAVTLGRSLTDRDVTILANDSGAYWASSMPDRIHSEVLERVCRHLGMTAEEIEREQERDELEHALERFEAERRISEAVEVIRGCATVDEALERLQQDPPGFSPEAARFLVASSGGRFAGLRALTGEGQDELAAQISEVRRRLTELGEV